VMLAAKAFADELFGRTWKQYKRHFTISAQWSAVSRSGHLNVLDTIYSCRLAGWLQCLLRPFRESFSPKKKWGGRLELEFLHRVLRFVLEL